MKYGNKKHSILRSSKGFTLVEVLVSVAIFTVGVVGSVSLIGYNISAISRSVNRLIASNLAQDGFELVRGVRDTNWLQGKKSDNLGVPDTASWTNKISGTAGEESIKFFCGGVSSVNMNYMDIDSCIAADGCMVYVYTKTSDNTKCYSDDFGDLSASGYSRTPSSPQFYRLISFTRTSGHELLSTVTVKWKDRGQWQTLVLNGNLFNWKN